MTIIGYTTGVFDLFHIGHLNILRQSKAQCDHLIVGVTTDELLINYKFKKSVIPFTERIEIIKNICFVDEAVPQDTMDKLAAQKKYNFTKMFVGDDWKNSEKWDNFENSFKKVGVTIIYFPYTKGTSSTLINEILLNERKKLFGENLE